MLTWIRLVAVAMLALGFLAHGGLVTFAASQVGYCKRVQLVSLDQPKAGSENAAGQVQAPPCKLVADRVDDSSPVPRLSVTTSSFRDLDEAGPDWAAEGFERPPKVRGSSFQPFVS